MGRKLACVVLLLLAVASPALAQRGEDEDDATYVHHAKICMGVYQYVIDHGPWDGIDNVKLSQAFAQSVYRELGGFDPGQTRDDTMQGSAAMATLIADDPGALDEYYGACDAEFLGQT